MGKCLSQSCRNIPITIMGKAPEHEKPSPLTTWTMWYKSIISSFSSPKSHHTSSKDKDRMYLSWFKTSICLNWKMYFSSTSLTSLGPEQRQCRHLHLLPPCRLGCSSKPETGLIWDSIWDQISQYFSYNPATRTDLLMESTSKMPPVPRYEWTSCPLWVLHMCTHLRRRRKKIIGKNPNRFLKKHIGLDLWIVLEVWKRS